MPFRLAPTAALAAVLTAPVLAHETWLLPSTFAVAAGQRVVFDLTSGVAFPEPEHAIAAQRIARAEIRCNQEVAAIQEVTASARALQLAYAVERAGVAAACVTLHPNDIELTDDQVQEYFAEIGAGPELQASWAGLRGKHAWKEKYTKHAKTFVAVGQAASADLSWIEPAGLAAELIPLVNPLTLLRGQDASFKLLKDGQPLAGARVGLLREGSLQRVFGTTDVEGRVAFHLDKPGRLLVFAVMLRYVPDRQMWESDFTSLTLLVGSAP